MSGKYIGLLTGYYEEGSLPLSEYPRPNFVRDSYLNLNGVWDFEISENELVTEFTQQITVPFSPESILSGVNKTPLDGEFLFYRRSVNLPPGFRKDLLILHFGAVDQEVDIYINSRFIKAHKIPFLPFSVDLSEVVGTKSFEILLRVKDKTRNSAHLIGKQNKERGGIWYTPQSGVWQTVWLESYNLNHLEKVQIISDFDKAEVCFKLSKFGVGQVNVKIFDGETLIKEIVSSERQIRTTIEKFKAWSPESPNLYDVEFTFAGETVKSYFAFRKIERRLDEKGISRFYLNNKAIFQSGVLDQGYYSDGLLTPPSDKAMIDDILLLKKMGFNMLRKHIKVEPLRFYYHCDRLGILVWQDMINLTPSVNINKNAVDGMILNIHHSDINTDRFGVTSPQQKENYYLALKSMISLLSFFPSIVTWVPFNEGWGQFDAKTAVTLIKDIDKSRPIDHASGWSDQKIGDYYSRHIYFTRLRINRLAIKKRIIAITEFGGYSLKVDNHVFNLEKSFGYKVFKTKATLQTAFDNLYLKQVKPLIKKGLSVIIYTQLSDVEDEINGLVTYDRKVIKMDEDNILNINETLTKTFSKHLV
ncbi:MAG TPA: glycoside hydrolase family 2 TIM barrel-domain containing protein [Bacilli bacterium]|nr:glycoside hydrolase family 2 TIM barrel-domain containing protein [Bacilli bacterium]